MMAYTKMKAAARMRKKETEARNAKRFKENLEAAIEEQNALFNVGAGVLTTPTTTTTTTLGIQPHVG